MAAAVAIVACPSPRGNLGDFVHDQRLPRPACACTSQRPRPMFRGRLNRCVNRRQAATYCARNGIEVDRVFAEEVRFEFLRPGDPATSNDDITVVSATFLDETGFETRDPGGRRGRELHQRALPTAAA